VTVTEHRRGIPTRYSDTQFRSRLEARWASFFDFVGWDWVYEPFDADGYIPDFLINGTRPFLVEVGPVATLNEYRAKGEKARTSFPAAPALGGPPGDQVSLDHFEWHTLVVGLNAALRPDGYRAFVAGEWALAATADATWGTSAFWAECAICDSVSVVFGPLTTLHMYQGPCGHDSDSSRPVVAGAWLTRLWREAGNRTQWRAPA
jgi:hypothetical protein